MDVESLASVLYNTFNPDSTHRHAAEQSLAQAESQAGYHSTLLQILTLNQIPIEIQKAAVLRLKNTIKLDWTIEKPSQLAVLESKAAEAGTDQLNTAKFISQNDKNIIKSNLFNAIYFHINNTVIRNLLLECMETITRFDWPLSYPALIPTIIEAISQSNDRSKLYTGLITLRILFKSHKMKFKEKRKPSQELVGVIAPLLLQLWQSIIQLEDVEYYEYQRIIIKTFVLATELSIPPCFRKGSAYLEWMKLIQHTLQRRLPANQLQSMTPEQIQAHPLTKSQKWCAKICLFTFDRYGRLKEVKEKALIPFAKQFTTKLMKPILAFMFQLLKDKSTGSLFLLPKTERACYEYFSTAINIPECYLLLKKNLQFILAECLLPTACLTQADIQCYQEDPDEFVRRSIDLAGEFEDPRIAARSMLVTLLRADGIKGKSDTIQLLMEMISKIFIDYAQTADNNQKNYIHKDGAMRILGWIKQTILGAEDQQSAIEQLFIQHIIPEFNNPIGFMRARACDLFTRYNKFNWQNNDALMSVIQSILKCSSDPDLPVRLESCSALASMVKVERVREHLKPALPFILDQMFSLIDEIGSWEVIDTLQVVVERFGSDIGPFAVQMLSKLTGMYLTLQSQLVKSSAADLRALSIVTLDGDDDDEAEFTAKSCVTTIKSIIYALEDHPELIPAVEQVIAPLLDQGLSSNGMDVLDEILDIIGVIVYMNPSGVSEFMWSLYPRLLDALNTYASDYLPNIAAPIDNYISAGTEYFIQSPWFMPTLGICKSLIDGSTNIGLESSTDDGADPIDSADSTGNDVIDATVRETPGQYGGKLLEAIMAHARFKIDSVMPEIIKLIGSRLTTAKSLSFKLVLIDCLATAAWYNPGLFIATLNTWPADALKGVMNYWLSHVEQMKSALMDDAKHRAVDNLLDEDDEFDAEQEPQCDLWTVVRHEKLAVLGLGSLMLVPIETFPKLLREAFPSILGMILHTLTSLSAEYKQLEAEEENEEDDDEDDGFDIEDNMYEGNAITGLEDEDEDYNDNDAAAGPGPGAAGDDDDADNGDGGDAFHKKIMAMLANHETDKAADVVYETPMDDLDAFIFFAESIESMKQSEPQFYQQFHQAISKNAKQLASMNLAMQEAIARKQKEADEKAKEDANKINGTIASN